MYVESLYHDMHDSATARKNRENPGGAALSPPARLWLRTSVAGGLALSVSGGRLGPLGSWLCNLDANMK
jgi:hypothetical protein